MPTRFEEGRPESLICFVGEAPSFVETRMGRPFVGPSGEVFNDCLHAAGIIRHLSYITNVFDQEVSKDREDNIYRRLHNNAKGDLLWHSKNGFTEEGLRLAQGCIARIAACKANVIVPLGRVAMQLCLGDKRPISKWRGSCILGGDVVQKRKCIPTFHPASTLHGSYTWRYIIMADFEKARRELEFSEYRPPRRNIIIEPSFKDTIDYMRMVRATKNRFATDLEVINHQVSCFCITPDKDECMVIPVGDEYGNPWWDEAKEMAIWQEYAGLMGDEKIDKINQNLIGFDVPFLLQQNNIFTRGFLGDTMIAQHIMYPDFKKGLDFICSIRTDEPYYKDEGKMWKGMGGDIREFWIYNGKDGCVALEAWDKLAQEMTDTGYWPTYNMTARLSRVLQYMTLRGFRVDKTALAKTHGEVETKLKEKVAELNDTADYPFSATSPKQCQAYFYVHKGIQPYKGANGNITTDDKAMARIYRRYHLKEAKLVQEIRSLGKLKGTYLEIEFDADDRLRCSWNPRGTWTGRLSSSQTVFGTGANMQNLHPEFLHFLVADEEPFSGTR